MAGSSSYSSSSPGVAGRGALGTPICESQTEPNAVGRGAGRAGSPTSSSSSSSRSSASTSVASTTGAPSGPTACSCSWSWPRPRPRPRPPRRRRRRRRSSASPADSSSPAISTASSSSSPTGATAAWARRATAAFDSFSPGSATRPPSTVAPAAATGSAATGTAATRPRPRPRPRIGSTGSDVSSTRSGRARPRPRPRPRPVPSDSLSGTSVMERSSSSVATRRPDAVDPFSTFARWVMSVKRSATSMRSELVLPRKLITSTRTPVSWTARIAGAKSPSPEMTTATSRLRDVFMRSTTSSMSRFALTLPSPYLRMSLLTTLYPLRARKAWKLRWLSLSGSRPVYA